MRDMNEKELALFADAQLLNTVAQCLEYNWDWKYCKDSIQERKEAIKDFIKKEKIKTSINEALDCFIKTENVLIDGYMKLRDILYKVCESDEDNRREVKKEIFELNQECSSDILNAVNELSAVDSRKYGFGIWDNKIVDRKIFILIPIYMYYLLPGDLSVVSINGNKSTIKECDKDTRGGCLAFGIDMNIDDEEI